jgi:uncharacterized repeat protein (TIGR03803 family)
MMSKLNWMTEACGVFLLWATAAVALPAQTFRTLASFDGTNGESPYYASLAQGLDGDLYGTTSTGGATQHLAYGGGTVFKITPGGTLIALYKFCSQTKCSDGLEPQYGPVLGADGNFYGTTLEGGTGRCSLGCGTIFKITPQGTLTTLYSFAGNEGEAPASALIRATDGNFYGTTAFGGEYGFGTVFRITSGGSLKTLHFFDGTGDSAYPYGGLVQATDGNFYGTTYDGAGTLYRLTPNGKYTVLYSFCQVSGCPDGANPIAPLTQGADGCLYGTTYGGGPDNLGTVFKITLGGALTTLHTFTGSDGAYLASPLIQATDGNFYGTTEAGGTKNGCGIFGCGTVFEITPSGTLTTLHSFDGTDGGAANGLVQDTNGGFYGTTYAGGANNDGTVFSLSVGLGPFVEAQPTSGPVGGTIKILGTDLTGATSVTFNGTAAEFTVVASSYIKTTIPIGATTGTIQVVTPGGTLSSNVPFTVK